jgi:L-asparagine transporter-like permease
MKKIIAIVSTIIMSFILISPVFADADDVRWIKQCVADNKDEGQTSETIQQYCTCMNSQMSSAETMSVTAWEKSHPKEVEACAKKSGWVGK